MVPFRLFQSKITFEHREDLLSRGLHTFFESLNPATFAKETVESTIDTTRFLYDIFIGNNFLSEKEQIERVKQVYQTLEALPEILSNVPKEQWVDIAAKTLAHTVIINSTAKAISFLQETGTLSKATQEVDKLSSRLQKGCKATLAESPTVVTPEGVVFNVEKIGDATLLSRATDKVRGTAKKVVKDAKTIAKPLDYGHSAMQYEKLKSALKTEEFTSVVKVTKHGLQRLIERGFDPEEVTSLLTRPDYVRIQSDGAKALIKKLGDEKYRIMVFNETTGEVVTALRETSLKKIINLGKNYGWEL